VTYGDWSDCKNNIQSRSYSDANHCGMSPQEPIQRSCIVDNPENTSIKPIVSSQNGIIIFIISAVVISLLIIWLVIKNGKKR
jgi:hypothetical protein